MLNEEDPQLNAAIRLMMDEIKRVRLKPPVRPPSPTRAIIESSAVDYVRMVEDSKQVAVEAVKLTFGKVGHVLATWPKQPQLPVAVNA